MKKYILNTIDMCTCMYYHDIHATVHVCVRFNDSIVTHKKFTLYTTTTTIT